MIAAGQPIDPFVCPRGHHSITLSSQRFCCRTCRQQGRERCNFDKSALVDLREREPPLAEDGEQA